MPTIARPRYQFPRLPVRTSKGDTSRWNPGNLSGLACWLDAQDATTITLSTGVSQWSDKSGNGRHFTQGTGANQPAYSGAGSTAGVVFDGVNDSLAASPFITALLSMSAFMVLTPATLATSKFFLAEDSSASGNQLNFIFATSSTTATIGRNLLRNDAASAQHNFGETDQWASNTSTIAGCVDGDGSGNITVYKDGTAYSGKVTSRTGTYTMTAASLARRANGGTGSCTACTIRELVIYDDALSQANREIVEGYLAFRWGLEGLLPIAHPYKSNPP